MTDLHLQANQGQAMIDPTEVEAAAAIDLSQRNTIITRQYPCGQSSREYLITSEEMFAEIE